MDSNLALHAAIARNDLEKFDRFLHHPDVDLNYKNAEGETPLMACIKKGFGSTMAMSLIRAGCDVNCKDLDGSTPLHEAIINNLIDVARHLILRGADINAYDGVNLPMDTPLSKAIQYGNLEAVCLLLYYQASVNIKIWNGSSSHLVVAIKNAGDRDNSNDIVEVLLDYCTSWYISVWENAENLSPLTIAVRDRNPIAIDLVKRGADVVAVHDANHNPLYYAILYEDSELFKLILPKFQCSYSTLLGFHFYFGSFLNKYIHCLFSKFQWLEGLYLILQSPLASDFIRAHEDKEECIVHRIVVALAFQDIELKDRISIIYILLSLSAKIAAVALQCTNFFCGPNCEFEAIVYAGDLSYRDYKEQMLHLFKESFKTPVSQSLLFGGYYCLSDYKELRRKMLRLLGFFSFSPEERKNYLAWIKFAMSEKYEVVVEELDKIPQLPSLLQLSRDQVQKCIEDNFKIDKAYQFFDVVKSLKLPQVVKDMILFKHPIY